jgi:HAD superfamily hydrolase (TIGR01457 family)
VKAQIISKALSQTISRDDLNGRLASIRTFAIDLDGTIYLGQKLFPFTRDFLAGLTSRQREFLLVTNNSSRSANDYRMKLRRMNLEVPVEKIYTSGDATIEYLRQANLGRRLFVLGTRSLQESFLEARFEIDPIDPEVVVIGFDTTLSYDKLDAAARHLRKGLPFIATHPDLNCPIEAGEMMLDCGAMAAALIAATGREPIYIGKPHAPMIDGLLRRANCSRHEIALIGDRLTTDILAGVQHGIFSILVLTGETKRDDLRNSTIQPNLVVERIVDLFEYL